MKLGTLTLLATTISSGVLANPVSVAAQNASSGIVTFDAPGASSVSASFDGTFPSAINDAGAITGHYVDANAIYHAFVRAPRGELLTFDAPGAGTSVGFRFGTFPNVFSIPNGIGINNRGTVTGNYIDASHVSHGFLRTGGGEFTTFDPPGASSSSDSYDGTFPTSINNGGTVTGSYIDSRELIHGFVRSPGGELTTFDVSGASSVAASGYGTFPRRINDAGMITGHYTDARGVTHGFLRSPGGELTTFDAPGASPVAAFGYGTSPESISDAGAVTGHYADARGLIHGFLRSPGGKFATFDAPGASSVAAFVYGTLPESINAAGSIAGYYPDEGGVTHRFLRSPGGRFATFDAPGAGSIAASGYGTFAESINEAGTITGHFTDAHGLVHGFLRMP